jgi:hypothetical protein
MPVGRFGRRLHISLTILEILLTIGIQQPPEIPKITLNHKSGPAFA